MTAVKAAIVGAGAIGGWIGARLAESGCEVQALARGATLRALEMDGWQLSSAGRTLRAACRASDRACDLGPQDVVVLAVKAYSLTELAPHIVPLIAPHTVIIPAMNGIPWWFSSAGPLAGHTLRSIDPDGRIAAHLPVPQVIGCVVHAACSLAEPAKVIHRFGNTLVLGEPRGTMSERLLRMKDLFEAAGFTVTLSERIRHDVWYKLWGNMSMNPISVLTGADCAAILDDPELERFVLQLMREAAEVGRRIGCDIKQSGAERNEVTRKLGAFKTSMLQDAEAHRPLELDALLSAPLEIARLVGVATPGLDALLGLTRVYGRTRGLYPSRAAADPADPSRGR